VSGASTSSKIDENDRSLSDVSSSDEEDAGQSVQGNEPRTPGEGPRTDGDVTWVGTRTRNRMLVPSCWFGFLCVGPLAVEGSPEFQKKVDEDYEKYLARTTKSNTGKKQPENGDSSFATDEPLSKAVTPWMSYKDMLPEDENEQISGLIEDYICIHAMRTAVITPGVLNNEEKADTCRKLKHVMQTQMAGMSKRHKYSW
jgi:hypothetical protein